jgi:CheY-like chemotaxis protein
MYEASDEDVGDESLRGIRHKAGSYSAPLDAYRVLMVAGDEELIALTRLSLAKNGLEVKAATTAYGALAKLEDSAHDLVILDTVLPDLSGWEVLRRIRGSSEVPVMLLTKRNSDVAKARGLDLGADDYLTKPFSFLEFEARVRALLRRARIANPHQEDSAASFTPAAEGPTVAIIVERRHLGDRALVQARSALESAGCHVPLVVPDANHAFDIPSEAPPWDAVLSRGRDLAGLGMLAAVSALGVIAINTPESIELVRNKIAMYGVLLEQDLPLPKTWFASQTRSPSVYCPWIPSPWSSNHSTATGQPGWRS